MTAVVVYESMFGNTHTVAERIGEGLAPLGDVRVVPVADATDDLVAGATLLVVGGPTHIHGMSRARTRHMAVEQAQSHPDELELHPDAEGPGLRDWFDGLAKVDHVAAAAFDTRIGTVGPTMSGRASKGIHKRLRHHGFREVADAQSFLIDDDNHLLEGEADRARAWGASLAEAVAGAPSD